MYSGPYPSVQQQIQIDAILSRQIYEDEEIQFKKELNQLESNNSIEYYVDSIGWQSIPQQDIVIGKIREQPLEHIGAHYRKEVKHFMQKE